MLHNAKHRGQGREVIICDFRLRSAYYAYQRGFAYVREANKAYVGKELQLKHNVKGLARETRLRKTRDLARRGRKMGISPAASAALCYDHRLVVGDIRHDPAGVRVLNDGSAGYAYHRRLH